MSSVSRISSLSKVSRLLSNTSKQSRKCAIGISYCRASKVTWVNYFRVSSWYMLILLSLILLRYCTCIRPVSRFSFNFSLACSAMIAQFTYFAVWLSSIKWSFWSLPMISLCCILSLQLGTWSWNLLCYMSLRMWHGQYSSHFMSRFFFCITST